MQMQEGFGPRHNSSGVKAPETQTASLGMVSGVGQVHPGLRGGSEQPWPVLQGGSDQPCSPGWVRSTLVSRVGQINPGLRGGSDQPRALV